MMKIDLFLLLMVVRLIEAVDLNGVCSGQLTCTVQNSNCKNDLNGCTKSTCVCNTGYRMTSSTMCKKEKDFKESCDSSADICKDSNMACVDSKCNCHTGYIYNTNLKKCILNSQTHIGGEACSTVNNCYTTGSTINSVECSPNTGTLTPMYCRCRPGYIQPQGSYICRKPHVTEGCTSSVGCASMPSSIDASQVSETCISDVCQCPSSAEQHTLNVVGETYTVCLAKFFGKSLKNGEACATSNQCIHKMCSVCQGQSGKFCVKYVKSGAAAKVITSLVTLVSGLVLTITV